MKWLPDRDSNPNKQNQNLSCYRYTIGQSGERAKLAILRSVKQMPQEHKLLLKYADAPDYSKDLGCYERHGGYQALRQALDMKASTGADGNELTAQAQLRKNVLDSGLRGRGGAGFPCGQMELCPSSNPKPVYLICNNPGDESEPGSSRTSKSFTRIRTSSSKA